MASCLRGALPPVDFLAVCLVDEQGEQDVQVEEPENIVQHLIASSSKEELARHLVQLQQETQRQKLIITRYREEKKLLLNQKVAIAKTLCLFEQIETSELEQNHPQIANSEVELSFGRIPGYTHWIRRDQQGRQGGGVAVCLKEGVQAQRLEVETPPTTEAVFLKVILADGTALLLCAMYRPPRQGPAPLDFLTEQMDDLLTRHRYRHVLIVGDLNQHMEGAGYENLLTVQGLTDHVTFPTHERGGTLDPVISDLGEGRVMCQQLGPFGSSDHHAILTRADVGVARDEATSHTIWLWDRADWPSLKRDLGDIWLRHPPAPGLRQDPRSGLGPRAALRPPPETRRPPSHPTCLCPS